MDQIDQLLADAQNTLLEASQGLPQEQPQLDPRAVQAMIQKEVAARVSEAINSLGYTQSQYVGQIPTIAQMEVARLLDRVKIPKDGRDGRDGVDGKDGKDGKRGANGVRIVEKVLDRRFDEFLESKRETIIIACGSEISTISTGTAKVTFRMPYRFIVLEVRASLTSATTSGPLILDVNESGVSILSTKLTIDEGETTSTTAATAAVISDNSLANDAEITIDVDDEASGDAIGLKVYLIGYKPLD